MTTLDKSARVMDSTLDINDLESMIRVGRQSQKPAGTRPKVEKRPASKRKESAQGRQPSIKKDKTKTEVQKSGARARSKCS